jgi:homocitrate synthase
MKRYYIIDSTLREGQQNSICNFTLNQKQDFLILLDKFGIEYAELINPNSSDIAFKEYKSLVQLKKDLGLGIKLIAHIRNHTSDIEKALQCNIDGIILSSHLNCNNKSIDEIIQHSVKNLDYIKKINPDIEIIFSTEDSFRTDPNILCKLFLAIEDYVDRIGITDTVGIATHYDIEDTLDIIQNTTRSELDIECHFHNDSSCAVSNAYIALLNGCTHINTCVLGIGERNGITDLSGLISRIYTTYPNTLEKYNLYILKTLDVFVSTVLGINLPINNCITGPCSFYQGVLSTCIVIKPEDFGLSEKIFIFSHIMDYNSLKFFLQNNLSNIRLSDDYVKKLCDTIKMDLVQDNSLLYKLNNDPEYAKSYILKYIS